MIVASGWLRKRLIGRGDAEAGPAGRFARMRHSHARADWRRSRQPPGEAALDDVLELLGRPWRGRRHDDGDDAVDAHDPAKQLPKEHRSE
jgi:hypothetical protein